MYNKEQLSSIFVTNKGHRQYYNKCDCDMIKNSMISIIESGGYDIDFFEKYILYISPPYIQYDSRFKCKYQEVFTKMIEKKINFDDKIFDKVLQLTHDYVLDKILESIDRNLTDIRLTFILNRNDQVFYNYLEKLYKQGKKLSNNFSNVTVSKIIKDSKRYYYNGPNIQNINKETFNCIVENQTLTLNSMNDLSKREKFLNELNKAIDNNSPVDENILKNLFSLNFDNDDLDLLKKIIRKILTKDIKLTQSTLKSAIENNFSEEAIELMDVHKIKPTKNNLIQSIKSYNLKVLNHLIDKYSLVPNEESFDIIKNTDTIKDINVIETLLEYCDYTTEKLNIILERYYEFNNILESFLTKGVIPDEKTVYLVCECATNEKLDTLLNYDCPITNEACKIMMTRSSKNPALNIDVNLYINKFMEKGFQPDESDIAHALSHKIKIEDPTRFVPEDKLLGLCQNAGFNPYGITVDANTQTLMDHFEKSKLSTCQSFLKKNKIKPNQLCMELACKDQNPSQRNKKIKYLLGEGIKPSVTAVKNYAKHLKKPENIMTLLEYM